MKGSGGTTNFDLLRGPLFLGPGMSVTSSSLIFEWFFNFHQIDSKNHPIGDSAHARRQKGGVPEAAEIGRTPIPFQNESTEGKLKNKSKNKPIGNSAHACRHKGGVPEETEIGRAPTPFQNESTEGKLKHKPQNKAIHNNDHALCQKGGVPEEAEICRSITPF